LFEIERAIDGRGADERRAVPRKRASRSNYVDPNAWLADILARIADLPASRLHELLPWESSCVKPTSPPISRAPDLHATP
jgi:hypothetical protein